MTTPSPFFPEAAVSLAARAQALEEAWQSVRDPQARLAWLVDRARHRPMLPEALRLDVHRVTGCQVRLWFIAEEREGLCFFQTDSDAVSLKALVGVACDFYSGQRAEDIAAQPLTFLEKHGILRQVAESRRATILRVVEQIHAFARSRPAPPSA